MARRLRRHWYLEDAADLVQILSLRFKTTAHLDVVKSPRK